MFHIELLSRPKPEFNQFIAGSYYGHLLQTFEWGEFKKTTGWLPFRLIVKKNNKIIAATSILSVNWAGKSFLYAPRGPVLDYNNHPLLAFLLNKMEEFASEKKAFLLKIDPKTYSNDTITHKHLLNHGFSVVKPWNSCLQPHLCYRFPLPFKDSNYHSLIKNKAKTHSLKILSGLNSDYLKLFYSILLEYSQFQNINIRSYQYFETMLNVFTKFSRNLILVAHKNHIIGAALVICFGDTCYNLYNVFRHDNLVLFSEAYLHLIAMEWAANQNFTVYEIIDTLLRKEQTSPNTHLFPHNIIPYTYLGEYNLICSPSLYFIWKLSNPLFKWSLK